MLPAALAALTACGAPPAVQATAPVTATATPQTPASAPADPAPSIAAAPTPDQPDLPQPTRVRLPTLGVDAAVIATGVDEHGEMEVPENIREAGWYRFSETPGSAQGSSVVAGHIDDKIQGRGAFYDLVGLTPGDPVVITTAAGTELGYHVTDVRQIAKAALPVDDLFSLDGPPRLTLITCGGSFDRASRNYRDNIVVTALPDR